MARFSSNQVLAGLKQFAGTTLSGERLRHLRAGRVESKYRRTGELYKREVEPFLKRPTDWDWYNGSVAFSTAGVRKLFKRYNVKLTPEMTQWMQQQLASGRRRRSAGAAGSTHGDDSGEGKPEHAFAMNTEQPIGA